MHLDFATTFDFGKLSRPQLPCFVPFCFLHLIAFARSDPSFSDSKMNRTRQNEVSSLLQQGPLEAATRYPPGFVPPSQMTHSGYGNSASSPAIMGPPHYIEHPGVAD